MKRIVCEMCGSHDFMKTDGMMVCQGCGTKYTTEEAKKMMVEVEGGSPDLPSTVAVKSENNPIINNYRALMENANASGSKAGEVYEYAEKILQLDSTDARAWYLKGISAGWLTTISNVRLEEAVLGFTNAMAYTADDKKEDLIKAFKDDFEYMGKRVCVWLGQQYMEYPYNEERELSTANGYAAFVQYIKTLNDTYGMGYDYDKILAWYFKDILIVYENSMSKAKSEFGVEPFDVYRRSNNYEYDNYINSCILCANMLRSMIPYLNDADSLNELKGKISRVYNDLINSCSLNYMTGQADHCLTESAKTINRKEKVKAEMQIDERVRLLKDLKNQAQEAANRKYWEENKGYKNDLLGEIEQAEHEIENINSKIDEIDAKIRKIKGRKFVYDADKLAAIDEQRALVRKLREQLSNLGLFKFKEKKELQNQIDSEAQKSADLNAEMKKSEREFEKLKEKDIEPLAQKKKECEEEIRKYNNQIDENNRILNADY